MSHLNRMDKRNFLYFPDGIEIGFLKGLMQYFFKRFLVLRSSKAVFSFLIKKSGQKAIEIEIAFYHSLGNPKGRTLDYF